MQPDRCAQKLLQKEVSSHVVSPRSAMAKESTATSHGLVYCSCKRGSSALRSKCRGKCYAIVHATAAYLVLINSVLMIHSWVSSVYLKTYKLTLCTCVYVYVRHQSVLFCIANNYLFDFDRKSVIFIFAHWTWMLVKMILSPTFYSNVSFNVCFYEALFFLALSNKSCSHSLGVLINFALFCTSA